ncbi:hypothetical protein MMC30_004426 [Trapelia coarctata]|nr:hypothetical protein [Trapelia coarctata]
MEGFSGDLNTGASSNGQSINGFVVQPPLPPEGQNMSPEEIALYDRQIRLWGVQAQEKLRRASILLIGLKALGNEIAKNLVLAGIGSLTIVDDGIVTEDDLGAQFFLTDQHLGLNRVQAALPQIQKLNPRVLLSAIPVPILTQPPEFFAPYTLTIATNLPFSTLSTINASCRLSSRPFYAAETHGFYGYIFADLIIHSFVISREKPNVATAIGPETPTRTIVAVSTKPEKENGKTIELVTKCESYSPIVLANSSPLPPFHLSSLRRKRAVTPLLSCLRALWEYQGLTTLPHPSRSHADLELFTTLATEKHKELQLPTETLRAEFLRSFMQNVGSEISPVCAFLGGQLAQDVINVVGGKEQPIQNMLLFDGEGSAGPVYALHPIFPSLEGEVGEEQKEQIGLGAAVVPMVLPGMMPNGAELVSL